MDEVSKKKEQVFREIERKPTRGPRPRPRAGLLGMGKGHVHSHAQCVMPLMRDGLWARPRVPVINAIASTCAHHGALTQVPHAALRTCPASGAIVFKLPLRCTKELSLSLSLPFSLMSLSRY